MKKYFLLFFGVYIIYCISFIVTCHMITVVPFFKPVDLLLLGDDLLRSGSGSGSGSRS
jgi:hypothetical protein